MGVGEEESGAGGGDGVGRVHKRSETGEGTGGVWGRVLRERVSWSAAADGAVEKRGNSLARVGSACSALCLAATGFVSPRPPWQRRRNSSIGAGRVVVVVGGDARRWREAVGSASSTRGRVGVGDAFSSLVCMGKDVGGVQEGGGGGGERAASSGMSFFCDAFSFSKAYSVFSIPMSRSSVRKDAVVKHEEEGRPP